MLEPLFESVLKERILLYIWKNPDSYANEIARNFDMNLYTVQNQLRKLERGGVLVSQLKGKVRLFRLNPRYAFKEPLEELLGRAYGFLSNDEKDRYYVKRKRPRRTGKTI